jgi:hypothetical protein
MGANALVLLVVLVDANNCTRYHQQFTICDSSSSIFVVSLDQPLLYFTNRCLVRKRKRLEINVEME